MAIRILKTNGGTSIPGGGTNSRKNSLLRQEVVMAVEVAGRRLTTSHVDFERSCAVLIETEQSKPLPDNALIGVLCDAIRLSRERCDAMAKPIESNGEPK